MLVLEIKDDFFTNYTLTLDTFIIWPLLVDVYYGMIPVYCIALSFIILTSKSSSVIF